MSDTPRVYPYRWIVLLVFMLISAVVQIQWLAHAAVARPAEIFYEGQVDPSSFFNIDFLAMVYMLVFIVMSFPASYVIDTYGIRVGVSIGAALAGVAGLMKGLFADSFTAVVIAQAGLAIAQPFILNAVTAVSVRWFPLRKTTHAALYRKLAEAFLCEGRAAHPETTGHADYAALVPRGPWCLQRGQLHDGLHRRKRRRAGFRWPDRRTDAHRRNPRRFDLAGPFGQVPKKESLPRHLHSGDGARGSSG
jgi:hypothetical protein